jgi:tellurite resistance protein TehA-like permease
MTRLSQKQYERQAMVTLVFYAGCLLFLWPLLHTVSSFPLKVLLALAPALPVVYLISLLARRIHASDEFEQRTHLIALGTAAAITGVAGMIGGFLSIAGVLKLDGSVLIWVFPVLMLSYSATRKYVLRRYGANSLCDEETSIWFYLRFVLLGVIILAIAPLSHGQLDEYRLGFLYGTGGGIASGGLALALRHWYRHRHQGE